MRNRFSEMNRGRRRVIELLVGALYIRNRLLDKSKEKKNMPNLLE